MPSTKTIRKRASRKPTGRWAETILDLRRRIEGSGADGSPHLTQPEFAKLLQVSSQTVSRWERGVQDPPPRAIEMLEILACNLGLGRDLEIAFRSDRDQEPTMLADGAVVGLLRCLFVLEQARPAIWTEQRSQELRRAATAIFGLARGIAADAVAAAMSPADRMLIGEVTRLLEKIRDIEASAIGMFARWGGLPVYTDLSESIRQTADGDWEATMDTNWMGAEKKVYRGSTKSEVLEQIERDYRLRKGSLK